MATLRAVRKRIRTVRSTRRITKAMEMVAAAKLRRAQQRVEQARPYAKKMDEMLSHLAAGATEQVVHPFFETRPVRKRTLVIFTSDRGLCGSFNSNIIRRATLWTEENRSSEMELVIIGKKGNDIFRRRPAPIVGYWGHWGGVPDFERARQVVGLLTERFVSGQTDEISLLFTRFLSLVRYRVTCERYLPVVRPEAVDETGLSRDYIFEPSPDRIYAALMPGYATTKLVTALVESFASEHGSRMTAMNAATKNAGEMIDHLTLQYNKARQTQITKELLEVVAGAEALRS
ncbi:MAG TPA: ATP synthase F1 subunit gamma [Candidatus Deferrimicrobium sp.]|nr:ATP synthase F1 subunit gamma [Candidatus Deferrimicrobium sp.]